MRSLVSLYIVLILAGCAATPEPHQPADDSDTVKRVRGEDVDPPLMTTDPGDIWAATRDWR